MTALSGAFGLPFCIVCCSQAPSRELKAPKGVVLCREGATPYSIVLQALFKNVQSWTAARSQHFLSGTKVVARHCLNQQAVRLPIYSFHIFVSSFKDSQKRLKIGSLPNRASNQLLASFQVAFNYAYLRYQMEKSTQRHS